MRHYEAIAFKWRGAAWRGGTAQDEDARDDDDVEQLQQLLLCLLPQRALAGGDCLDGPSPVTQGTRQLRLSPAALAACALGGRRCGAGGGR